MIAISKQSRREKSPTDSWSSNRAHKLLRVLLFCTILFLPLQIGKHFWPAFSLVDGIRIDYLSPTLYATDILIGLLFVIWLFQTKIKNQKSKIKITIQNSKLLVVLVFTGIIGSIFLSASPMAGFYKFIKILEFVFFGFMVAKNINLKKDFIIIALMLAAGIIFESVLATWQFINQSSIGGVFWFFGERTFSGQTAGIANANITGQLILRPYGTFPHPNVLAGYFVIAMTIVIFNFKFLVFNENFKFQISNFKTIIFVVTLIIGAVALFLTLSRVAIIAWLVVMSSWFIVTFRKKFIIYLVRPNASFAYLSFIIFLIVGSIILTPLPSRFTSIATVDKESFVLRQKLNSAAIEMFKSSPVLGVGLNNFLVNLPHYQKFPAGPMWLQPVHNVFLLVAAETGLIGLSIFLWFIGKTYWRIRNQESGIRKRKFIIHPFGLAQGGHSLFIIFSIVIVLGLFDHYFLTLQQGQLLLALVFGLCWSKEA